MPDADPDLPTPASGEAAARRSRQQARASLVATVLDAGPVLETFLASIDSLDPAPAEVVVVDGGSQDGTYERLLSWASRDRDLRVVSAPGANIATGRNIAIGAATSATVVVTDAGASFPPDWLGRLVEAVESGADVACGFFVPGGDSRFERILGTVITPDVREIDPDRFLPSSRSVAFTKAAWEAVGGYPEWLDYCEDLLFDMALKERGARFAFVPEAVVTWDARPDLRSFAKQYYRYARGDGKAGILGRRHAVRYTAYLAGAVLAGDAVRGRTISACVLAGLTSLYLGKAVQRVLRRREALSRDVVPALSLVPVIVVVGDVAKMVGYPVGLVWRLRRRARQGR